MMKRLMTAFWADETGFILSAELVVIATVAVLGLTVMLVAVRDAIGSEMTDLANAFRNIDQSYGYSGIRGCRTQNGFTSWTAGSHFLDPQLRQAGSEQDIVVEDYVVGTSLTRENIPCNPPVQNIVPVCPAPGCPAPVLPAPGCNSPDCPPPLLIPQEYQGMIQNPQLQAPMLEVPCTTCQQNFGGQQEILPTPSSDIPPSAVRRSSNFYYPPFSQPVTKIPAGPLQVW